MFKKLMLSLFAAALTGGALFAEEQKATPPAQVNQVTVAPTHGQPGNDPLRRHPRAPLDFRGRLADLLTDAGVEAPRFGMFTTAMKPKRPAWPTPA